jgi:hypothetical protein
MSDLLFFLELIKILWMQWSLDQNFLIIITTFYGQKWNNPFEKTYPIFIPFNNNAYPNLINYLNSLIHIENHLLYMDYLLIILFH